MNEQLLAATTAIRAIEHLSCEELAQLFNSLGCKMKDVGFSDLDLEIVDQVRDAVCGEVAL